MIKLTTQLFFLTALLVSCSSFLIAQSKNVKKHSNGDKLITTLAHSDKLPALYRTDEGLFANAAMKDEISPDVKNILALGKNAIPLLIRHLDDKRDFSNLVSCCSAVEGVEKVSVSVGVLNMLTAIIRRTEPIYDLNCLNQDRQFEESDDDCLQKRFYWGKHMKRNWLKAYRAGQIHYKKYVY